MAPEAGALAEAQVVALAERLRRERVVSKLEPEPPEA